MKTMLLILSLLLSVKTNATTEPITILKKLQPAPFTGVLMPESKFRFYVNTADTCAITDEALHRCQDNLTSQSSDLISVTTVTAFLLGGLAVYYIKR
jgi:hypothetical protein